MLIRFAVSATMALCVLTAGSAAMAESASATAFKGKTSQGHRIKFAVKERSFKIVRFEADLKCNNGSRLTLIESGFLWTPVKKKGVFRDAQFGKTDSVYFKGRLTERRIKGRVRLTDKLRKGVRCKSRWIAFKASAR